MLGVPAIYGPPVRPWQELEIEERCRGLFVGYPDSAPFALHLSILVGRLREVEFDILTVVMAVGFCKGKTG
jgi:hypothetical protein